MAITNTQHKALQKIKDVRLRLFAGHHVNSSNMPMSFDDMPYLVQIYNEASPEIYLMGGVQNGKTDWMTVDCFSALTCGLDVFHVFAKSMSRQKYFKNRVNPLCDRVPVYKEMEIGGHNSRNQYSRHIGDGKWIFAVSQSATDFDATAADIVAIDEYDSCDKDNVKLADDRLQNSRFRFKRISANPSLPGEGIAKLMEESKYYVYHWKCAGCGKWIPPDFFKVVCKNITDDDGNHIRYQLHDEEWREDLDRDIYIQCPHCEMMQDREKWIERDGKRVYQGKWIPKHPEKKVAGYWMPLLIKLGTRIEELWDYLLDAEGNDWKIQLFYNKRLGLPYEGIGSKLDRSIIGRCTENYTPLESVDYPTFAGVDVGKYFDIQIGCHQRTEKGDRKRRFLNAYRCESLSEIEELIGRFNIRTIVFDSKPETNLIQEFARKMYGKCRVWLAQIENTRSGSLKIQGMQVKDLEQIIRVDRDWALTEAQSQYNTRMCIVPDNFLNILNGFWIDSMESISRTKDPERDEYTWSKKEGKDHCRFSDMLNMIAFMMGGEAILMQDKPREEKEDEEYKEPGLNLIRRKYGFRRMRRRR